MSNLDSKGEKWTNKQIELLIEAYKEKPCLYATNHVNYHSKHLRERALARVCEQIKKTRPTTTAKECIDKLHNLRNQFNIEHSKVRASIENGAGPDDIYQPSLWYFQKLLFLEKYLKPRKNRNSLENKDVSSDSHQETARKNIKSEIEVQDHSSIMPLVQLQELDAVIRPASPISPQRPSKKRRQSSSDDVYTGAIHELAKSMMQPITINTIQNTGRIYTSSVDPVDSFLTFIGSLLQSFQDEELKLEMMNNITQTVINANSIELQRAKNKK